MIGQISVAVLAAYYDMYTNLWALTQTHSLAQTLHTNVDTHTHRGSERIPCFLSYHSEASLDGDDMASLLMSERFSSTVTHVHIHTHARTQP